MKEERTRSGESVQLRVALIRLRPSMEGGALRRRTNPNPMIRGAAKGSREFAPPFAWDEISILYRQFALTGLSTQEV